MGSRMGMSLAPDRPAPRSSEDPGDGVSSRSSRDDHRRAARARPGAARPVRSPGRLALSLSLVLSLALALALSALHPREAVAQDYGSTGGWRFLVDHDEASSLIVGLRRHTTWFGNRRLTWAGRLELTGRASVRGGLGADVLLQRRLDPSGSVLALEVGGARRLRSYRFYGYGNDRPLIEAERTLVRLDEVWLDGSLTVPVGTLGTLSAGPTFLHLRPASHARGPLVRENLLGSEPFSQVGVTSQLNLGARDDPAFPRLGAALIADASVYAPLLDAPGWFGDAKVELRGYLPLPLGGTLASRMGVGLAWGDFPVHEAAFVGGSETLRGHRRQRFAGDGALFGAAELRVPLVRLAAMEGSALGAIGFVDAARVFLDGESPGGWHTANGGGLWVHARGLTVTGVVGWGEERHGHLYLGLPF